MTSNVKVLWRLFKSSKAVSFHYFNWAAKTKDVSSREKMSWLNDLLKEKEEVEKELSEKYDRWTYLNELAEKIEQSKK